MAAGNETETIARVSNTEDDENVSVTLLFERTIALTKEVDKSTRAEPNTAEADVVATGSRLTLAPFDPPAPSAS